MLESRPDSINYLRGLNAEFRALAPAIMGEEPGAKCSVDSDSVDLMERISDGKRYLIVARRKEKGAEGRCTIHISRGLRLCQGEGAV